jgi:hypothetical protein
MWEPNKGGRIAFHELMHHADLLFPGERGALLEWEHECVHTAMPLYPSGVDLVAIDLGEADVAPDGLSAIGRIADPLLDSAGRHDR